MIMPKIFALLSLSKARLSRRIALWVFASIIIIELIILFPSYYRREQELLKDLENISGAIVQTIARLTDQEMSHNFKERVTRLNKNSIILGVALYNNNGELIEVVGEAPEINFNQLKKAPIIRYRNPHGDRYDVAWSSRTLGINYVLIVRHNSSMVQSELSAYVGRIALLVLLISFSVALVTVIVLGITVILPILRLRDDLIKVGEVLNQGTSNFKFYSWSVDRQDELGEVMLAFKEMFQRLKKAEASMRLEQEKSESLLLNILPEAIAKKLKEGESNIAQRFDQVTILFADLVGFTEFSTRINPEELIQLLNEIFSKFDAMTEKYGLEKIKTIGDSYMVAGGIPIPCDNHAELVAEMALDMQVAIREFSTVYGESLNIRIGINTGPVVAGVIGTKKFIYDLWGDAVNTASRMESHGIPGAIQVTAETYRILQDKYILEERGLIEIKGKGKMATYLLMGRKAHI